MSPLARIRFLTTRVAAGILLLSVLTASGAAQSFNVDLDVGFGDQQGGNGAPSATFGAAADSPGYWNRINAGGPHNPVNLAGLNGMISPVQLQATGGVGTGGGFDNFDNTGDFALLLNDFARVGDEIDYHLTGLSPGRYLVFTYAVNSTGYLVHASVTVPGADVPIKQVTGPMPGNQFIEGITHSRHEITLTGTSLDIDISGPWPDTEVNGFQVVAVPEPVSLLALGGGLGIFLLRSRVKQA